MAGRTVLSVSLDKSRSAFVAAARQHLRQPSCRRALFCSFAPAQPSAGNLPGYSTAHRRQSACRFRHCQVRASSSNGTGDYDYDLFTIGAGSGGVRASRFASTNYGAKVAICEMPFDLISSESKGGAGGTCVLRGCVPKKLMVYGGEFAESFEDAKGFGWDSTRPGLTWERFMDNKNKELDRLNSVYMKILANNNVTYHEGRGKLLDAHTIDVDGKQFTAKHILIATGGKPTKIPIEGAEHAIISDQILNLSKVPKKLAIIGGGYIALEFAGIYNHFGAETHVFYRQPLPLRGFDEEVRNFMSEQYQQHGLNLHPQHTPVKIEKAADGTLSLTAEDKDKQKVTLGGFDHVLMATGRQPNTQNMGLEEVGVKLEKSGAVAVDKASRTSVPNIWAIGDVTNRLNLTPVALMEGMAFAATAFGDNESFPDYENVASAVFSSPPLAHVGLSEEQAVEKYGDVDVYTSGFKPMRNTISGNQGRGFQKIVVDAKTDRVLGMHMVGPECAEIMQGFAAALKIGLKKKQLDTVVGIHPSSAEEFVTMRSPERRIRNKQPVEAHA
ncbi:hypothetical protein WJX73_005162 [Symbiochloris irregularis]|uniref:glutathione-disulfide reductase n=1 Tax=Symbiochloris irregularis TaxID=706552 RepID=A0AAW1NSW3_9CHLO